MIYDYVDDNNKIVSFTKAEMNVVAVVYDGNFGETAGGFTCSLIDTLFRADRQNFAKLSTLYPELANAVKAWSEGDLSDRVNLVKSRENSYKFLARRSDSV